MVQPECGQRQSLKLAIGYGCGGCSSHVLVSVYCKVCRVGQRQGTRSFRTSLRRPTTARRPRFRQLLLDMVGRRCLFFSIVEPLTLSHSQTTRRCLAQTLDSSILIALAFLLAFPRPRSNLSCLSSPRPLKHLVKTCEPMSSEHASTTLIVHAPTLPKQKQPCIECGQQPSGKRQRIQSTPWCLASRLALHAPVNLQTKRVLKEMQLIYMAQCAT